ncbi:MAG: AMP-binding protein [Bacteroidetes Order II. Incertae sedis bacterium]|jgi:fatty-acyl-CoA synthase|nr:AMP-binding protein [Bacteroidetes Order II. bacterium]MBT4052144.1 AMP-binding protein [Bacteroidetes Order II. bacterium]MBT5248601.1 AMP-binding protein [Bacteroidetes Order II. bacterium]MBT6200380.1 AMP-binding protein [Bacteroidetes Order II. bacterium]MBT6425262.1 AMP-binding protein [Bacteroidetes Order II. bacterium]
MNPLKTRRIVKSYWHRGGKTPLLGVTIPEHLNSIIQQHGGREALVSIHQNDRLTYSELGQKTDDLAKGLLAIGFHKGSRVGIWSTNHTEWILMQLATARIGVVLVNINPAYKPRELAYAIEQSELEGLFLIPKFKTSEYVKMTSDLIPELAHAAPDALSSATFSNLRRVVVFDPRDPKNTERPLPGYTLWNEVMDAGRSITDAELDAVTDTLEVDDPINIQYTSGTTGFPKGVVLTHHNLLNNALAAAKAMKFTRWDKLAVPIPFYHCFGMVVSNLMCFSVGATVVIPGEYFRPEEVLFAIESEKCTAVHGVPTMFVAELEHKDFHNFDLNSLRTGIMAGAPCPPVLLERVMNEMHDREILIGYGQTESSPLAHLTKKDDTFDRRVNSIGTNVPHTEVKIVDPGLGVTMPFGEVGEICFRGYHVMKGYYNNEEATRQAIDENGWLHSGDLGTMDSDGYVKITGRLKDMVIRGGENIYPRELEDFLFTHPKVAEVAVFGIPDERLGEDVMAWVVPHDGDRITVEEIKEFCKGHLAHFKIPRHIWFVAREDYPMTVTGKIQKFKMRDIAVARMSEEPVLM